MAATSDYWKPPFYLLEAHGFQTWLVGGERNPQVLAQMARTRMRTKIPQLEEAFVGYFTEHHRFLLAKMLSRIAALDATSPRSRLR